MAQRVAARRQALQHSANERRQCLENLHRELARHLSTVASDSRANAANDLSELEALESELDQRRQAIQAAEARLKQQRLELDERARQLAEDTADLLRKKDRYEERSAQLEAEFEAIETEKTRTIVQRKRIAEQLREERRARGGSIEVDHLKVQLRQVTAERDTLNELLKDAQQQLAQQPVAIGGTSMEHDDSEELAHLQGKYELAMSELRELRRTNAAIEAQLAQSSQEAPTLLAMDWESQKRRMLAALEAEERKQPISDERAEDRLTIEGTIQITDQMIADKDAEIAEFKRLLKEQSQNVGEMAVGAAAIGALLDTDEIIRQERERLAMLETELNDKLRQTEIDLSRERARVARDRVEIDDLRRQLDIERQRLTQPVDASLRKAPGGNWLTRLGLKGNEGE